MSKHDIGKPSSPVHTGKVLKNMPKSRILHA